MRLRSHLQILTVGTLLPVVVFGLAAGAIIAERERELVRRGGSERTLALLTAVDAKLEGYIESLRALAGSSALSEDDLTTFHAEMRRALQVQPGWHTFQLVRSDGALLLDAARPFGTELGRVRERPSFDAAVRERRTTIRDLYPDDGDRYLFGLRVPVVRQDSTRYVLSVLVDPIEMHRILERQRLPADWVGVVLDANNRIVARTRDSEEMVGRLASVSLRNALSQAPEGWFRGSTLEGDDVYTPYTRSASSGWTVAIGMRAAGVDSGAAEIGWIFAAGAIAAVLAAILLANGLSRRIARPISSLATAARAIGRGEPVDPPTTAGVREVREVSYVLARAAKNVRDREAALQAADRAKDEFIAMLGHELRNPLSALTSAAEILHFDESSDPNVSRAASVIERQVRHMSRLVDDLLDVSRLTTGKVHLELSPVHLGEVVQSVLDTFDAADRLSEHEIDTELAPLWVRADRSRIEQITSNLLGNALKYTPPGGRVSVTVRGAGGDGGEAVLEVEDTGAGLDPELAPRVFESFVQGDHSLDRESGGLGLGLTLVKSLVDRHGGTVEAHSDGPGRGARFTVRLPTIEPPAPAPGDGTAPDSGSARTRRILVIEDNDDARETLTIALESLGHDVLSASDGATGLALIRDHRPHVALIDIGLPRMDGFEIARRIRTLATDAGDDRDVPRLVALTGYSQEETRARAETAGFDRWLTKPVAVKELAGIIEELLSEPTTSSRS